MFLNIDKRLKIIQDRLFLKTKYFSRRYMYDFLETETRRVLEKVGKKGIILNIGSSGNIHRSLNRIVSEVGCYMVTIDIDMMRRPEVVSDICDLSFEDSSFDCVVCFEVLEHVHSPKSGIDEIFRILKGNGELILTTRFIFPLHDRPMDYWRFTKYGLEMLMEKFRKTKVVEQLNWIETLSVLILRILKEEKGWIRIWARPIYYSAILLQILSRFFSKRLESDYISSGYFVTAQKGI